MLSPPLFLNNVHHTHKNVAKMPKKVCARGGDVIYYRYSIQLQRSKR